MKLKNLLIVAVTIFFAQYTWAQTPKKNKQTAIDFYEMVFNKHQVQAAADRYIGKEYWQHNPEVKDGKQAFVDTFTPFLKQFPHSKATIKRAIAQGDLVVLHVHSQTSPEDIGTAVIDIFRFDKKGKIVEHWDVSQPIPTTTASGRGMF